MQVPAGTDGVAVAPLEVVELATVEVERMDEDAAIDLEEDEELAGLEVVELGVVGAPPQPSCVEPISQALLVAKPLNKKALIAFKFAPEKELKGTVIV